MYLVTDTGYLTLSGEAVLSSAAAEEGTIIGTGEDIRLSDGQGVDVIQGSATLSVTAQDETVTSLLDRLGIVSLFLVASCYSSLTCSINLWLVVITQAVHLFLVWLADKMNLEHGKSVWGLGYSCVLFALMTTIILKGDTQCPVNLYGLCFPTYEFKLLPFPSTCTELC